ncbi:MAG TPA: hypothetical protein VMU25_04370 [Candidatus Paceibacterota bacterium]|nr:hypothetical protein [Candidatus Paceibacterota bacterium]
MFGHRSGGDIVALADIRSGSAAVAIIEIGTPLRIIAFAREHLPLEKRSESALMSGVIQALGVAGDAALKEFATSSAKHKRISKCICIVGAPWTQSIVGTADTHFEKDTTITEAIVNNHAQKALTNQTTIDAKNLFEATVVRVLLNGYPTGKPVGKKATDIHLYALISSCNEQIKAAVEETLHRLFPGAKQIAWRSSARAVLTALQEANAPATCMVVDVDAEATDLLVMHKGALVGRDEVSHGVRSMTATLMPEKTSEETLVLIDMLEKDRCDSDTCDQIKDAIARAEPDLAHTFGEKLALLSAKRRVPEQLVLIAPERIAGWLSQFFTRIDFTQFTVTTEPFIVSTLSLANFAALPQGEARLADDPNLMVACALVNTEYRS